MDSKDDTFIIIVGNDEEIPDIISKYQNLPVPKTEIKDEPVDNDMEEETYDANEYSQLKVPLEPFYDLITSTPRWSRTKEKTVVSFIEKLKESCPELNDDKMLVEVLAHIMKETKPPILPAGYFTRNGNIFNCSLCGAPETNEPAIGRHYQRTHGVRYLFCFACGADFRSTTNLYKHEKRCNAPDIVPVLMARAQQIGNKARSRPFLQRYAVEKKRFECNQCSATFVTKHSMMAHAMLHDDQRPFLCPHCPSTYTSSNALARHMKKHSGIEYVCDYCGRKFNARSSIIAHFDTHLPMKKYPCEECDNRYSQKAALLRHVDSVHRKLPPRFTCQLCPRRCNRMSILKEHMKKMHGMVLVTQKMFYRSRADFSQIEVEQAKLVLKSEMGF
ncbi:zinc finger protein interacting with ribonucleoprotein K-like isoform X2 [Leptidea sinapis]|uniref:zinc finger protein interacting with ribonucleoprotein K-like isoform X2 n=1 Tax=Leptidea sinapis TaxID=189913 RepID=UPI00213A4821|nr:zinc finger protein interacting with ribonucleoprotein K-like isoform X2 [Leptidea sinapis]